MMNKVGLFLFCSGALTLAQAADVTVYNQDLGLVRETRTFTLKNGVNTLSVTDVPAQVDATSVHFKSLTNPDAVSVLEQNFQYDLLNQQKLLDKYVGKEIEIERPADAGGKRDVLKGTLLSNNDGPILKIGDKIHLNLNGHITLPDLPNDFRSKPTLEWKLLSKKAGPQTCELSYLTAGLGWRADYVLVANATDDKMDLNSWVTITNTSGGRYDDAKLKLVAGDVNRVASAPPAPRAMRKAMFAEAAVDQASFHEQSFFEYHLYTLQRPTTLANNETKQIEMASAADVPMKKLFVYDGAQNVSWLEFNEYSRADANYGTQSDKKVWVILEFKNSKDNKLGMPLPKGRVRVYKKSSDGALEFIGEDNIDHTPKDETLRIKMGNAFDVGGERARTSFLNEKKSFQETFEIRLRNHKESDVVVRVVEHLYRWNNWKIAESSQKYTKKDAQTVEFETSVKKDGETVVTYTVKYTWP
jgi:hypothetical protein